MSSKSYLRYVHEEAFGLIASAKAPVVTDGVVAYCPAVHEVLAYDLRRGELSRFMTPDGDGYLLGEVTALLLVDGSDRADGGTDTLAVGYSNGMVRCYSASEGGAPMVSLMGHKGTVKCLASGDRGMLLASGGNDTDLVVWDLVAERGVCRLRGHKDAVTAVRFIAGGASSFSSSSSGAEAAAALGGGGDRAAPKLLASASKDGLVKVWDLSTQHCVQTIVGHRSEVWSLAASPAAPFRLVSGTNDERLRVWALHDGPPSSSSSSSSSSLPSSSSSSSSSYVTSAAYLARNNVARYMGFVSRTTSKDRCVALQYHHHNMATASSSSSSSSSGGGGGAGGVGFGSVLFLGVQSAGKLIDIYRVRSAGEAAKKLKRRVKRHREKLEKARGNGDVDDMDNEDAAAEAAAATAAGAAGCPDGIASDELELAGTLRSAAKLVSFAFLRGPAKQRHASSSSSSSSSSKSSSGGSSGSSSRSLPPPLRVLLSLQTNAVEVHEISVAAPKELAGDKKKKKSKKKSKKNKKKGEEDDDGEEEEEDDDDEDADVELPPPQKLIRLELPGHRTDPRFVCFSSDASMLASAAAGSVKVWSTTTRKCVRSVDDLTTRPALPLPSSSSSAIVEAGGGGEGGLPTTATCVCWLGGGDEHLAVGTKEGALLLLELSSGLIVERLDGEEGSDRRGHGDCVWAMDLSPDGATLATGSADKQVKFWGVEIVEETVSAADEQSAASFGGSSDDDDDDDDDDDESSSGDDSSKDDDGGGKKKGSKTAAAAAAVADESVIVRRRTRLVHARTLQMGDEVMSVRFSKSRSASKLLLAVATLDFTVRVFFANSLKFFLQLYGHSLPVHAMDCADDSTLMATGGADKTLKIWGLDFGDCHRSLLAHQDAVTAVAFVPRTHYIFTASKDKTLKYWDADHFEQILTLQAHVSEVWSLAVSRDGSSLASAGGDRTLRMWCRTDEPVFLEEEREKELEAMVSSADIGRGFESMTAAAGSSIAPDMDGGGDGDDEAAARRRGGDDMDDDFEGGDAFLSSNHHADGGGAEGGRATKRSEASLKAGERLMEALEVADHEDTAIADWEAEQLKTLLQANKQTTGRGGGSREATAAAAARAKAAGLLKARPTNPLLLDLTPDRYVLRTLRLVKRPDLEEALLVLPYHLVERLVERLARLLEGSGGGGDDDDDSGGGSVGAVHVDAELCTRCAVFLVRLHHAALSSSGHRAQGLLRRLRDAARRRATEARDLVGGNLAALKLLKRSLEADREGAVVRVDEDASGHFGGSGGGRGGKKKRKK